MTDDLNDLRQAMDAATPQPDARRRAKNLAEAQEKFKQRQGSTHSARPISDNRPFQARLMTGVMTMIDALTSRGGLVATTALVAIGVVVVSPQGRNLFVPPQRIELTAETVQRAPAADQDVLAAAPKPAQVRSEREERDQVQGLDRRSDMVMEQANEVPFAMMDESAVGSVVASPKSQLRSRDTLVIPTVADTETFANESQNPLRTVVDAPVSTFSIDVDTAAYGVVRSSLTSGRMPPRDAVRVEELINYFPYDYARPAMDGAPFESTVSVLETPWNADTQLVHIALQGQMPAIEDRPPLNLVFLIDTSGSMQDANKLPLLKQSFRLMLGQLRPEDQVAIVTYAGSAGQVLAPTDAANRSVILGALDNLDAGGSTAGQAGLQQAYDVAENMSQQGQVTRVLLATDGDFNVGISDPDALKDFIADKRDSGVYLSVLGFGRGNLDDATMQALAQNGNGQAAYIDTLSEAQKVLVDQLAGALFPIANDVKIQVEFNPATVAEYRLIGYETRGLRREDFNNDAVDAGEIGAGHSVTAIYEVTPVGSAAVLSDPLRYQSETTVKNISDELGFLRLRYKTPGTESSQLIQTPIVQGIGPASIDAQFGVAIAGFGQLLRGSDYLGDWGWGDAIALASQARGRDDYGYRSEAVSLMRLAQSLSE